MMDMVLLVVMVFCRGSEQHIQHEDERIFSIVRLIDGGRGEVVGVTEQ